MGHVSAPTALAALTAFAAFGPCATAARAQRVSPLQPVEARSQQHVSAARAAQKGARGGPVFISIEHFQYNAGQPVTVEAGQSVVWVNRDPMQHTASTSAGDWPFDTGLLQGGQQSEPVVFLSETGPQGIDYHCNVHDGMAGRIIVAGKSAGTDPVADAIAHETPSVHSMVVTGSGPVLLSHIALFHDFNHQYQVTLEAEFTDPAAGAAYASACAAGRGQLCVVDPEYFLLGEIGTGKRTSFRGAFFQGAWQQPIPGLQNAELHVRRVIESTHFQPSAQYPAELAYRLVGAGGETYLVSRITEAPNFQEVVRVSGDPSFLTPGLVATSPVVTVVGKRLRRGAPVALETALLDNTTHILLSPPTGALNPQEPLHEAETITVIVRGDATPHHLTVERLVWFDVRILNK